MLRGLFGRKAPSKETVSNDTEKNHPPVKSISEMKNLEEIQQYYDMVCKIEDPAIRAGELQPFAEAGFHQAMLELALANEACGKTEEVFTWLKKAAEAGNYAAYYEWGIRTLQGAAELAKQQGYTDESLLRAGLSQLCDAAGGGVQKAVQALTAYNHTEREETAQVIQPVLDENLKEWAQILDENDTLAHAQYTKGLWYFYGVGYAQDLDKAREWLQKAAAQGHQDARDLLENPLLAEF